jgi:hypothetical protein
MTKAASKVIGHPPVATQQETISALLERSNRTDVPIRKTFLQQGQGKKRDPGPVASLVSHHDERALDLYLLVHAIASGGDFDVTLAAGTWARALGLSASKSSLSAVSKAFRRLDDLGLLTRRRDGSRSKVTLLDESGSGDDYTHPATRRQAYLKLPHAYWDGQWHLTLDLPAKVVLLIALSLDDGFILPIDRVPAWYGISADTANRGLLTLQAADLLAFDLTYKTAPLAPAGYTQERHYTLRAPFGPLRQPLASVTTLKAAKAT